MRLLVTGSTGFVGRHLTEHLLAEGHEVFGTTRRTLPPAHPVLPTDHLLVCDICDPGAMSATVRCVRPEGVFHLAASTSVAASFNQPESAYRTNLFGSLNLFSAVAENLDSCRIVWVGSSDAYGQVSADELPVTERNLLRPLSPYGVSKAAADLAAFQWSQSRGLDIVRVRPFNHTGPGQQHEFVCADFAAQIAAIRDGKGPPRVEVGNLDVVRDFSDVRDVARAYLALFHRGTRGEAYNVCSGVGRTPRQILETLLQVSGIRATVAPAPERQRPSDVPALIGSAAKLTAATGWTPAISFEQTLRDLLSASALERLNR